MSSGNPAAVLGACSAERVEVVRRHFDPAKTVMQMCPSRTTRFGRVEVFKSRVYYIPAEYRRTYVGLGWAVGGREDVCFHTAPGCASPLPSLVFEGDCLLF